MQIATNLAVFVPVPVQKLAGYPQKHPIFEGSGPQNGPVPAVTKRAAHRVALLRDSGGYSCIGGYRVFLAAIELFVYQVVELYQRCIQIISGKGDQK